jgi:hypothetical protein
MFISANAKGNEDKFRGVPKGVSISWFLDCGREKIYYEEWLESMA